MKLLNVYESSDYRKALARIFQHEKDLKGASFTLAKLARLAGLQPSYVTNVTKGRAHFSADQIHAIAEHLTLGFDEAEFLCLLMEEERALNPKRKRHLKQEIESCRRRHLRAEKVIAAESNPISGEALERYYLDPYVELLHLYLGLPGTPVKAAEIARRWRLPEAYVAEILAFLRNQNLVRLKAGRWERDRIRQHLPRESPLTRPSQLLKKMKSLDVLQRLPEGAAYSFSASVTTSESAKLSIQARFLEFLKSCEKTVKESDADAVYQIQFDLFPWIAPD